ncbi:uncharacterized protein LOC120544388 isoform X1 [Perca fluviatilis]|uniref:uncharacterized protein LOC120544388 isoform X1 n=1 Tax=Perca fluviatilis TaxID=8168 RepID=UPI0019645807|nr:uncharacterized protein LOC120544388 isoform X1 [Perca fluviatilis]
MESFLEAQWLCPRPASSVCACVCVLSICRLFMARLPKDLILTGFLSVALRLYKEFREARNRPKDNKGLQDRQKRTDHDSLLQGVQLPQQVNLAEESLLEARDLPSEPVQRANTVMEFQEPENREGEAVIRKRRCARAVFPTVHTDTGAGASSTNADQDWPRAQHWPGDAVFPALTDVAYCQQGQHSAPASPSQGWSPYQPSPAPASHSQGWSPYQPSPAPASHSQGWSPYQPSQSPAPATHSQGWNTYQLPPVPASHSHGGHHDQPPPAPTPQPQGGLPYQPVPAPLASLNLFREWRLRKATLEDKEREIRGDPPKKRQTKESYHYQCKICGQSKSKLTGHTQLWGKWYCPASGQTITEWKSSL